MSGFSRSTPAAILESEHRVASLWGSQSTFLQSVASSSVVSSQEAAPSFQGMNGSSSSVFEASNALSLNRRFSKKDVLKLNFKFPGRNGWGREVENKLHSHTMIHFLGEESIFNAQFKFQREFGVNFRGDNHGFRKWSKFASSKIAPSRKPKGWTGFKLNWGGRPRFYRKI